MKCPICTSTNLLISERQGIEIDYCPQCRGVWLDRGELDKLIERGAAAAAPAPASPPMPQHQRQAVPVQQAYDQRYGHGGHPHRDSHGYDYKRKKKGFLGEIFDFD